MEHQIDQQRVQPMVLEKALEMVQLMGQLKERETQVLGMQHWMVPWKVQWKVRPTGPQRKLEYPLVK